MKTKSFFSSLKIIAISLKFILIFSAASFASFMEETDDSQVYLGFNKFGIIRGPNYSDSYDLDRINYDLAKSELEITRELQKVSPTKRNNIALGCLTVIVEDDDRKVSFIKRDIASLEQEEEKLRAFESTLTPGTQYNEELLKKYYFERSLNKLPELIEHVNKIWGKVSDPSYDKDDQSLNAIKFSSYEKKLWEKFTSIQARLWKLKEDLKNLIIQTALTSNTQKLNDLALHFTTPEINDHQDQAEILRDCLFINKDKTPSKLLKLMEESIAKQQKLVSQAEEEFRKAVTAIYSPFWHSEQRLIHFLSSPAQDAFWESLEDEINGKVIGVFIHLHSRFNICPTCRRALSRATQPKGMLWARIRDKLNIEKEDFPLKILSSFRVHYGVKPKDSEKVWLFHKVLDSGREVSLNEMRDTPPLYLRKVWMGDKEEREEDSQYLESWKKYLNLKSTTAMSNQEVDENIAGHYSYINSLISNLESRISFIESAARTSGSVAT